MVSLTTLELHPSGPRSSAGRVGGGYAPLVMDEDGEAIVRSD